MASFLSSDPAAPASPIVLIPARLASVRLPDKPLADINGEAMIVHVWRRAVEADVGPVVVACAEQAIADAIRDAGGEAVLTRADHPSGSDRIFEALQAIDPGGRHDAVVNLQGDLPTLEAEAVRAVLRPLADPAVDIASLVVEISDPQERRNPNVVKAAVSFPEGAETARALYFSRAPVPYDPWDAVPGEGSGVAQPLYHHIGIYSYRRAALETFVSLPPSPLEQRERLEQLRALEAGLRLDVARVDTLPLGVDTPADLERARALLAPDRA
ncbi:3-deoxy-manno-octulosonate cytidylyltransferase [Pelagibius litoralis]|uniref:3-deoxy-manno-octulosonate cytidylyltransferase n=1 Tax=Pelagibius litoralis TaxID=374515 RepID=A0A967F1E7_9PROT|nr:3-deoxy-manno-octulosonate cytidylyltransferase [Pelagibius litoralis]NIA71300.1 3-deoxy-manno-octulosonate cytidylyltransferase [Pelagibius litoralis]